MFPYPISFLKSSATSNPDFITEWTVPAATTITLPSYNGTFLYDVDWGDGITETGITALNKTHDYSVAGAGTYTVTITGQFASLRMDNGTAANQSYLTKMDNWGTTEWHNLTKMFYGCSLMTYTATDYPNLTVMGGQTTFLNVFRGCDSITSLNLSNWQDTDVFTDWYEAFRYMDYLQELNISNWDLSNGRNDRMFWDVGISSATGGCNINLTGITCSSGVAGIQSSRYLFRETKFNNAPILANVDATGTTGCSNMFRDTEGAVDIDLSTFQFSALNISMEYFAYLSDAASFTFGSSSDFSAVTTWRYAWHSCPNLTALTFPANMDWSASLTMERTFYTTNLSSVLTDIDLGTVQDFSAVTNWTYAFRNLPDDVNINFSPTANIQSTTALSSLLHSTKLATLDYDNLLIALDAVGNAGGNLQGGDSTHTLGLVDSGTTDGTTADKLVDSTQNFITTVTIGDVVVKYGGAGDTMEDMTTVTAIDSNTVLSLDADMLVSGDDYAICDSAAVKAKESLFTHSGGPWVISDKTDYNP